MERKTGILKVNQHIFLSQYEDFSAKVLCESLRKFFNNARHTKVYGTIEQYERLFDYDPLIFDRTEGLVDLLLNE